jgi:hypothetical protein
VDDSDSDLDAIAYVASEDDERGPGCLVALAVAISFSGLLSLLITVAYAWSFGILTGGSGKGPGVVVGFFALLVGGMFGLFGGGAGQGMSLHALRKAKLVGRKGLHSFLWLTLTLSFLTVVAWLGFAAALIYLWKR